MLRMIPFEFSKIWRKRSFLLSMCVLLLIHLFLLWYTSLPNEETPPLSAYKTLCAEISGKSETEKALYLSELKEKIDSHPGMFEKYYDLYQSGEYCGNCYENCPVKAVEKRGKE